MEVDLRSADPEKLERLDEALYEAVRYGLQKENSRHTEGPPLTVDITPVGARPAGVGNRKTSVVTNATKALKALGIEASLTASSTDANVAIAMGIPAVTISRGGLSGNSHSPDEYWDTDDAHLAIQLSLLLLAAEAGLVRADAHTVVD